MFGCFTWVLAQSNSNFSLFCWLIGNKCWILPIEWEKPGLRVTQGPKVKISATDSWYLAVVRDFLPPLRDWPLMAVWTILFFSSRFWLYMYIVGRGQMVRRDREGQTRELSQRGFSRFVYYLFEYREIRLFLSIRVLCWFESWSMTTKHRTLLLR